DRVISAKSDTLAPRRPGVVGLYLRMPISNEPRLNQRGQEAGPPKISIGLLSGCRVTIARLVSLRLPNPVRVRLRLPLRLIVFTFVTLTSKIFSTAILISVLFERGSTRKVYWFCSSSP